MRTVTLILLTILALALLANGTLTRLAIQIDQDRESVAQVTF